MTTTAETRSEGLRNDALGFWDSVAIGVDSTAPAYSLAAVLGSLVVVVGVHAPAVLIVSFLPMLCVAGAYHYLNKAEPDCGTTFTWVRATMGPWVGWLAGWAVLATGVMIIGALADVAAVYALDGLGFEASRPVIVLLAVGLVLLMTWLCARGVRLSARIQQVLVTFQVSALLLLAVVAAVRIGQGDGVFTPSPDWFTLSGVGREDLVAGLLLGVFIYWGWETTLSLTEETRNNRKVAGAAGLTSTVVLVVAYVVVAVTMIGYAGTTVLAAFDDDAAVLAEVAAEVLGPLGLLMTLAIVTSALASTQTTILPSARTGLNMAEAGALPSTMGRIDPATGTPIVATWVTGAAAAVFYVVASTVSENFLADAVSALALLIAFYYAMTAVACVLYWRRHLFTHARSVFFLLLGPSIGAATLFFLLVMSARDLADPEASYTGSRVLGLGLPLVLAVVVALLGVAFIVVWRLLPQGQRYFAHRTPSTVDPALAATILA